MKASIPTVLFICTVWVVALVANVRAGEEWLIYVFTSDIDGAGTTGDVSVRILGTRAKSTYNRLPVASSKFKEGKKNGFTFTYTGSVGQANAINVRFDTLGKGTPWHLDRIELKRVIDDENYYVFPCHCWFYPARSVSTLLPAQIRWTAIVYTSDKRYSMTDTVLINILGTHGESGMRELSDPDSLFSGGSKIKIDFITDFVGVPKEIIVKHKSTNSYQRFWNLDKIELIKDLPKNGNKYLFECDCQLDKVAESHANNRTVELANPQWRIVMVTGKKPGAGTDGKIYIQFGGSTGATQSFRLNNPGDDFENGDTDVFTISTNSVGTPSWVKVSLGNDFSWQLNRVELQWTGDVDKKYVFHCDCWLNEKVKSKTLTI